MDTRHFFVRKIDIDVRGPASLRRGGGVGAMPWPRCILGAFGRAAACKAARPVKRKERSPRVPP